MSTCPHANPPSKMRAGILFCFPHHQPLSLAPSRSQYLTQNWLCGSLCCHQKLQTAPGVGVLLMLVLKDTACVALVFFFLPPCLNIVFGVYLLDQLSL